jgi:salicylate hydroxylase
MRVAIVGGGIGGLAAALALAAPDREITIYEQADALGDVGAGVQLSPNAVCALRALGIDEALRPYVMAPEAITLRDARSDALLIRSPLNAAPGAPYWHARRADLQRVLAEAVVTRRAATLSLGARIVAVKPAGTRTRLQREGGEAVEVDLLVAADGVRSTVRRLLFGDSPMRPAGLAWRGIAPLSALDPALFPPVAAVRLGPGRHFVSYRVGGDAVNFVGVLAQRAASPVGWSEVADPSALAADFAGWPPAVQALIAACTDPRRWALSYRKQANAWTSGSAVLLGDAAHPVPPHLAQGAAMALEDAVVLGRALAGAPTLADGLGRYEAARRPRTGRVVDASRRQGRLLQLGGVAREAAYAGLRVAGVLAPSAPTTSLSWLYGYDAMSAPLKPKAR